MRARKTFLHNYITAKMSKLFVPSLTLAMYKNGEQKETMSYGFRDLENNAKATPDTIYEIASITKTFTATAIMQLVERGKLSLDDPVERYLPIELKVMGEPVRIWHLLSHTSGIAALGYAEAQITSYLGQSATWLPFSEPLQVLRWLEHGARKWVVAPPGERFLYLNEGFVALGMIIEKVSGLSYSEYIKKNIIEPLKLNRTRTSYAEVVNDSNLAKPYDNTIKPPRPARVPSTIYADGGMYSSSPDLARFMQTLAKRGRLEDVEILSSSYVKEMEKPRAKLPIQLFGNDSYGLGLIIYDKFFDDKLIGHSGSVLVYTGYAGYIPGRSLSIATLANANASPRDIAMVALSLEMGFQPEELPFYKIEKVYDILEGVYYGYEGTLKAKVERLGDYLLVNFLEPPGEKVVLEPAFDYVKISLEGISKIPFRTRMEGRVLDVEFKVDNVKGSVEVLYERYRLLKVASLDSVDIKRSSIRLYP
jgi:CubicO group peptidase (beta-lactamase class C family)